MPAFVIAYIFHFIYFFNYQLVISLEQRLRLNISIEYIYALYQHLRPCFLRNDLYRAHYCRFFRVHQKAKPGRKPVFSPGNGHNRFVDRQGVGHRHWAISLLSQLEPAAAAIFDCAWSAALFLCA